MIGYQKGFIMLTITEQMSCSENFMGKLKSISIVDQASCYKLLLEQQLAAGVIFHVWYCCGNKFVTWRLETESANCWQWRQEWERRAPRSGEAENEVLKKDDKWDTERERRQGKENRLNRLYLLFLFSAYHLKHWSHSALLKCFEAFVQPGLSWSRQTWRIFIDSTGVLYC